MQLDMVYQDKKGITEIEEATAEDKKKKIKVAEEILDLVFKQLGKKMPQLLPSCSVWKRIPVEEDILLETDGLHLFYQPERIIRQYRERKLPEVMHRLIHMTLHGLLNHFEKRNHYTKKKLVDAAMDYEVEQLLACMGEKNNLKDIKDCGEWEQYLRAGFRKIYYLEMGKKNSFIREQERKIQEDNHEIWNRQNLYHCMIELPEDTLEEMRLTEEIQKKWANQRKLLFGNDKVEQGILKRRIKDMTKGDAESKDWGKHGGGATKEETAAKENYNSYRHILEQFFRKAEGYHEEEGTIDRMLYSYGFDLYGDVALIEPEEVTEVKKLNTIVIALDTSGSCCGEIMRYFLRETKNILRDICDMASFENILFLQCDAEIQKEQWFREPEDIPQGDVFQTSGFGGTDFRPVFERIEELREQQDMQIDCLLFLSDGYGDFPEEKTDYTTFFIVPKKEEMIPEWVQIIELPEGIRNSDWFL